MHRPSLLLHALLAASIGCTGTEDTRPPTWSFISTAIVEPSCGTVGCHSTFTSTAGIALDRRDAGYHALVDNGYVRTGTTCAGGEPPPDQHSQLLDLLDGNQIYRMPPDEPLPLADVALIRAWICAGAGDD